MFAEIEQAELEHPSPRKIFLDRTVYRSRSMPITNGPPMICDFGAARIGEKHVGDVMPGVYRAPEIIMGMEWNSKIDMWSFGVMVRDVTLILSQPVLTSRRFGTCLKEVACFVL